MPRRKSKKILIYFLLFISLGTLSHNDFYENNLIRLNQIIITGLDEKNNNDLVNRLDYIKLNNLFFLEKTKIIEIINTNPLIEKYSVFINYPSTLNIEIEKTKFLAKVNKDGKSFFLGSNGKLIESFQIRNDLPSIYGDFNNENFFNLKKIIDESDISYEQIKNLFFFKTGRWDIETHEGLLIKLPKNRVEKSIKLLIDFLDQNKEKKLNLVDLRQYNQIVINE
tara:strand:+ start:692 stop:1363 length:672 start_codon:yes stop_codon:yes gene_type:complete